MVAPPAKRRGFTGGSGRVLRHHCRGPVCSPAIDRLFRLMVDAKASDLHLSSGMPALIRKDGRIQPSGGRQAPITPAEMIALLDR